jgi:hypothetical protein
LYWALGQILDMSAPELNFLSAAHSQVRFDVSVRNFRFKVFFVDSRMDAYRGISTSWWGIYIVSVDLF